MVNAIVIIWCKSFFATSPNVTWVSSYDQIKVTFEAELVLPGVIDKLILTNQNCIDYLESALISTIGTDPTCGVSTDNSF